MYSRPGSGEGARHSSGKEAEMAPAPPPCKSLAGAYLNGPVLQLQMNRYG